MAKTPWAYQDLIELQNITFSTDCVEGSYSMSFDNRKDAVAIVSENLASNHAEVKTSFFHQKYSERTLSIWFKAKHENNSPDQIQYLIELGGHINGLNISLKGDKVIAFIGVYLPLDELRDSLSLQGSYLSQEWTHVVVRFMHGKGHLFINGKKVAQDAFIKNDFWRAASKGGALGGVYDVFYDNHNEIAHKEPLPMSSFNGLIDSVKFFNVGLTREDIHDLYQRGRQLIIDNSQKRRDKNQHSPSMQTSPSVEQKAAATSPSTSSESLESPSLKFEVTPKTPIHKKKFTKTIAIGVCLVIIGLMIVVTSVIVYKTT